MLLQPLACHRGHIRHVRLQVVDNNGIRDITPSSLKGAPIPGRGLEPGQGQAAVVVAG